jgi:hypothetical protein
MEEEERVEIWDLGFAWRSPDDLAKMVQFNFFTVGDNFDEFIASVFFSSQIDRSSLTTWY